MSLLRHVLGFILLVANLQAISCLHNYTYLQLPPQYDDYIVQRFYSDPADTSSVFVILDPINYTEYTYVLRLDAESFEIVAEAKVPFPYWYYEELAWGFYQPSLSVFVLILATYTNSTIIVFDSQTLVQTNCSMVVDGLVGVAPRGFFIEKKFYIGAWEPPGNSYNTIFYELSIDTCKYDTTPYRTRLASLYLEIVFLDASNYIYFHGATNNSNVLFKCKVDTTAHSIDIVLQQPTHVIMAISMLPLPLTNPTQLIYCVSRQPEAPLVQIYSLEDLTMVDSYVVNNTVESPQVAEALIMTYKSFLYWSSYGGYGNGTGYFSQFTFDGQLIPGQKALPDTYAGAPTLVGDYLFTSLYPSYDTLHTLARWTLY